MWGWECAYVCLHALWTRLLCLSFGMQIYIAGFTVVNVVGVASVPCAFIRSVRWSSRLFLLSLSAAGYALSWFFYNLWHHMYGYLCFGYYVWTLSLWLLAYGLALLRRPQKNRQPMFQSDEANVWPPPPTVRP